MTEKQYFTRAFAPIIWEAFKAHNDALPDSSLKRSLRESIHGLLQKWTDRPVDIISEKFSDLAKKLNIDPWPIIWKDRALFGNNANGKNIAVWEHTTLFGLGCA